MARIISVASHLPSEIIDNEDLSSRFPSWSPEKIYLKTGIRERRIASKDETSGDLAVEASRKLFERVSINRSEIDMLIFVTQTPNQSHAITNFVNSCKMKGKLFEKNEFFL